MSWDGGAGTADWEDAANWSGDALPGPEDDVQIPAVGTIQHSSNSSVIINSLSSDSPLEFSGGTLSLADVSVVTDTFSLSGSATLTGSGYFFVLGLFVWSGGTMSGSGRTQIFSGGRLEIVGNSLKTLDGRAIVNQGLVAWIGTGGLSTPTARRGRTISRVNGSFSRTPVSRMLVESIHH